MGKFRWVYLDGTWFMLAVIVVTVLSVHSTNARIATAVLMVIAEAGLLAFRYRPWLVLLGVAIGFGLAAFLVAPSGLAEIPVLVGAARLPTVLADSVRWWVIGVVAVLFSAAVVISSHSPVGLLAAAGVIALAQRTVERGQLQTERDRAVALLAEVQASRDAQAEAAASGERERIARDMHDVLAHSLAGLSIQLQAVRAVAGREGVGEVVTEPLQRAADLARDGIAEARAAVGALNPPAPRGVEAIEQLVARFPGDATWHSSGMPRQVESSAGHAVYRAVQEALTNAARYAPGARVAVEVAWTDDQLVVSVSDGGAVRPASFAANGTGTGLASMTERIEQIGGRLEAGPSGSGWLVRVTLVPVTPSYPAMPSPIMPSPVRP